MDGGDLLVVVVAVAAGGVVKSVSGMGLPVIAVPLVSLVLPLEEAVACTALPGLALNGVVAAREWGHRHQTRDLPVLALTGLVGAVAGALLLVHLPEGPVLVALGIVVLTYVGFAMLRPELHLDPEVASRWSPVVGTAAGVMQGATGVSGPVAGTWIHAYRLPRDAHVLAVSVLFLMAGVGQVALLWASGTFAGRWLAALAGLPLALAAVPVGARIRSRLSGRGFDLAVLATLALAAVAILVRLAL